MSQWTKIKWDETMLAAARRGLVKAGINLVRQITAITPVGIYPGTNRVGGRLKGSITYATNGEHSSPTGEARSGDEVSVPQDNFTLHVGTNVEYAPPVEYGHRQYGSGRQIAPQSFLRRGLDIMRIRIGADYASEISKELKSRAQ